MATHTPPHVVKLPTLVYVEKLFSTQALCICADSWLRRKPLFYVCKHIAAAYMRLSIFIQPAGIPLVKGASARLHRGSCYHFCQIPKHLLRKTVSNIALPSTNLVARVLEILHVQTMKTLNCAKLLCLIDELQLFEQNLIFINITKNLGTISF